MTDCDLERGRDTNDRHFLVKPQKKKTKSKICRIFSKVGFRDL